MISSHGLEPVSQTTWSSWGFPFSVPSGINRSLQSIGHGTVGLPLERQRKIETSKNIGQWVAMVQEKHFKYIPQYVYIQLLE
jgi:hypothetical protein